MWGASGSHARGPFMRHNQKKGTWRNVVESLGKGQRSLKILQFLMNCFIVVFLILVYHKMPQHTVKGVKTLNIVSDMGTINCD